MLTIPIGILTAPCLNMPKDPSEDHVLRRAYNVHVFYAYIYIYIYIYRERERYIHMYIYIYIYTYTLTTPMGILTAPCQNMPKDPSEDHVLR